MEQYLFFHFLVAGILGALVGLERDLPHKNSSGVPKGVFGGIRSFALISIIGATSAYLDKTFDFGFFTITSFIIISIFILASYVYSSFKQDLIGQTTEYSGLATYFIGVLTIFSSTEFAIIFTILITVLLSSKQYIEEMKSSMHKDELIHALKFGVIAFVILPILPDKKYSIVSLFQEFGFSIDFAGSVGVFNMNFFNPYSIWFFVVAMSSISYIGYILSKFFSKDNSIILSSIVGGMVSSTAVTATMSEQSKKDEDNYYIYVVGTMLANTIMLARVVFIVLIFNIALIGDIFIPAFLMFLGLISGTIYFYLQSKKYHLKKENIGVDKLESPFSISPALKFGLFVIFIKFISAIGVLYKVYFGALAFYFLGIVSGLADVDAITNDMAMKSKDLEILPLVAVYTILLAVMSNNIVKASIALKFGGKSFGKNVAYVFLLSIFLGILAMVFMNFSN